MTRPRPLFLHRRRRDIHHLVLVVPTAFGLAAFGLYTIVEERQCKVYVLFGKVIGHARRTGIAFAAGKARARGAAS